jgi:hypothetical protein
MASNAGKGAYYKGERFCGAEVALERKRARNRKWANANRHRAKAWAAANTDKLHAAQRRWRLAHPDYQRQWNADHSENLRVKRIRHEKKWPGRKSARRAKRRVAQRHATVAWADLAKIEAIYARAEAATKATGIRHEVDHIVPLQNPNVCGLHVDYNLQVLTKKANRQKWNSF